MRRLALALAVSACGHAAVLANAQFVPEASSLSLLASGEPIRARISAPPPPAETIAQRAEPAPAAAPAGLPASEIYYRGKEVDVRAEVLNEVQLEYPDSALFARVVGRVTLQLRIDRNGGLRDASVLEAEPRGLFEAAALKAVRALKFKPALRHGAAVGSIKVIEVPFDPDCARAGTCIPGAADDAPPR